MMNHRSLIHTICVIAILLLSEASLADSNSRLKQTMIERGRYLVKVSGCNDCHTPNYLPTNGQVADRLWLTGDRFGWNGPWGTTYGSNLRLFMAKMSEDQWVKTAKTLKRRPPMPWFNLNAMTEKDLRAIYQFTRSLGAPGEPAPAYVPVGVTPSPPYAIFPAPPGKMGKK